MTDEPIEVRAEAAVDHMVTTGHILVDAVRAREIIQQEIETAIADRDHLWWKTLCGHPPVAQTPEAVKQFLIGSRAAVERQ